MKKLLVLLIIFNCQFFIVNCNAQPLSVSASVIQNVSCHGGDNGVATCTPAGGSTPYTYLWSPGSQTTQTATGLVAATYTIKVTDYLNNTATASVAVLQPAAPLSITAWASRAAVCPGQSDSLYASSSGGSSPYSYTWTGPIGDISCVNCQNTSVLPYNNAAAYMVTAVVDAWGCSATGSVNVTVSPFPYVTISGPLSPVIAYNNDTLIALSPGASSYLWSNSATTSTIIVSPATTTTYSIRTSNTYGCIDTAHITLMPGATGNGTQSNPIVVTPSTNVTSISYSSMDSAVWFTFTASDSNNQIVCNSAYLGLPFPHVHRLTLYDNSMNMLVDEPMPDIVGANEIRIDISHLTIGNTYYVRASRCPASNLADINCNPISGECNPTMRWDFQMCFRTVPVFVPNDSGNEAPAISQLYYEDRGQIADLNNIPRFDIKAYTNNTKPAVFCSDSAVSFVYQHVDTAKSFVDTFQRVDMVLAGSYVQPSQPVFKMQEDLDAGYLNYFLGYAPGGIPQVEGYSRLVYNNVYPNVSMQVFSNSLGTKFYFICAPAGGGIGAGNPANIELQFKGASSVNVTGSGGLNVVTELGTLSFAPGYAYEDSAGTIVPTSWQPHFVTVNSNTVKFNTGSYNTSEPLIIRIDRGHRANPSYSAIQGLNWSTYVGGTDGQAVFNDVCSDDTGNVYATGYTQSKHYPVRAGVFQTTIFNGNTNNVNATVAKFSNSNKDSLIWATYYGGGSSTVAYSVGLDASGNIYIAGVTNSSNLPLSVNPSSVNNYVQDILNNSFSDMVNSDAFIAMLSNNGKNLYWATYYGGIDAAEYAYHLAIDNDTNIYVVGGGVNPAVNTTFPLYASTKPGAYNDSTYGTGFALEFNATHAFDNNIGITLKWATRLGDNNHDTANDKKSYAIIYGCTTDSKNNFYVTGVAMGYGYTAPATLKFPYKGDTNSLGQNAVVTRFNSNNNIVWSSYFGGNANDMGYAIAVDKLGDTYITGSATSDSSQHGIGIETKPFSNGYFQRHLGDTMTEAPNAFIAEFDSTGNQLWGTYFGGSDNLVGYAIKADEFYDLYLTGYDYGTDMPLPWMNPYGVYSQRSYVSGQTSANSFIAAFATAPSVPVYTWGTYFGNDVGTGLTLTHVGSNYYLYMVGNVGNGNTPLVDPPGSYFDSTYYFSTQDTVDLGTSFISLFDISPIIGSAGINTINNPPSEMLVYPNPTMQDVTIQLNLPQTEQVKISLFNLLGEVVFTENVEGQQGILQKQIPLNSLPTATYIIQAETKDKVYYNKITKLQ